MRPHGEAKAYLKKNLKIQATPERVQGKGRGEGGGESQHFLAKIFVAVAAGAPPPWEFCCGLWNKMVKKCHMSFFIPPHNNNNNNQCYILANPTS